MIQINNIKFQPSLSSAEILGRIHSIQSMGTVDGPGVRYVVFLQGCNLRCGYCHNPDTWQPDGGKEYSAKEMIEKAIRFKEYFGTEGGITLSGGEPLLQAKFATELFRLAHKNGINTCLDTSGSLLNDNVKELLAHTDRVLLDIKFTSDELYKKHVGCSLSSPLAFLDYLNDNHIPTTLRQVIVPTINDDPENMKALKKIIDAHKCIDKTELLPFRKICQVKYDSLKLDLPFGHLPEPSREKMKELEGMLD